MVEVNLELGIGIFALILTILGLFISYIIQQTSESFSVKKIKETKKNRMFDWVHNNLSLNIYIPLAGLSEGMAEIILWKHQENDYREKFLLYTLSKLLKYRYENRKLVGDDIFYTGSTSSNRYLYRIFNSIVSEINNVLEQNIKTNNKTEGRLIALNLLSLFGDCENYMQFISLLNRRIIHNTSLMKKLNMSMDNILRDNLIMEWPDQVKVYLSSINLLYSEDMTGKWRKAKLYTYCSLFSYLMNFELFEMYESWYEERERIPTRKEIHASIDYVCYLVNATEYEYTNYNKFLDLLPVKIEGIHLSGKNLVEMAKKIDQEIIKVQDPQEKDELIDEKNKLEFQIAEKRITDNIEAIYYAIEQINQKDQNNYYYII